jgi:excisionase family DNA binding protein
MYIASETQMAKELKLVNAAEYLTVEEAAKDLGINPGAIRNYLWEEKLTTFKFKTLTLVSKEEVDRWKKRQK